MPSYRDDLKGRLSSAFKQANPGAFGKVTSEDAIQQIASIEKRKTSLLTRMKDHCKKREEGWAIEIGGGMLTRRNALNHQHPAPRGVVITTDTEAIMKAARRQARAKTTKRLSGIRRAAAKMRSAVVRNSPSNRQAIVREATQNPAPKPANDQRKTLSPAKNISPVFNIKSGPKI